MSKNNLIGQSVVVYLDGGWKISGEVKKSDDDKIFIEHKEEFFMVYKNKISVVLLNAENRKLSDNEPVSHSASKSGLGPGQEPVRTADATESPYGMSIPLDMLTEEAQREHSDDDFSVYFTRRELGAGPGGISFDLADEGSLDDSKK